MRGALLQFLGLIEQRIPPPSGCHHALMSIDGGLLALQINVAGNFKIFIIEPGDFDKGIPELVAEIVAGIQ